MKARALGFKSWGRPFGLPWAGGTACPTTALILLALGMPAAAVSKDACKDCHSGLDGSLQAPATAFAGDVHAHRGFTCAACHGGDPASDDPEVSMSRAKGFLGKIKRTAVAALCAKCHSDSAVIHKFKPTQRVDQHAQYLTSVHGKRMAAGDDAAATCTDCHGVHGIREVKDPLSPVHPLKLPETCSRCHSSASHMAKYKIETNQFATYRGSVHWEALAKRGDLSAPSCASCHGNHGATPPQVSSVAAVCGSCHALLEDLYNKSPHQPVFASMGSAGCVTCHGNHGVKKPSPAMLAGSQAVCAQCHEPGSAGGKTAAEMAGMLARLTVALGAADESLSLAHTSGMEVSEALLRQQEAHENLVKARVAVHSFRLEAVQIPVEAGLAIAAETRRAGEDAMRERDTRRKGLLVSLATIFVTIAGLWLALRHVERRSPDTAASQLR